jgi:DNA-binding NarL/FixJ family response regulator
VETHVSAIFSKLGIEDTSDDNRRVLSVLTWLRDGGAAA